MIPESFPCHIVTWDEFYHLARTLSLEIKSSGWRPDLVVAIGRGGYVPARVVCDFLIHERLTSIKVEHWGIAAQKRDHAVIRFPLATPVEGETVLIVDDVTDTGETLTTAVGYVESLEPEEVRTAVLQHKSSSAFKPDYYAEELAEWRWIIYPWAVHEDLVGFTGRVLSSSDQPISKDQLRSELKRRFDIDIGEEEMAGILEAAAVLGAGRPSGSV
ncbi:MAG: phosphoribosyltransferase [Methanothrix sp.]